MEKVDRQMVKKIVIKKITTGEQRDSLLVNIRLGGRKTDKYQF